MGDSEIGSKVKWRRSIDRRLNEVRQALDVLVTVTARWLWEMQRRREQAAAPDGLGASMGDGSGSRSSDETSSTERAALRALPGCRQPHYMKPHGLKVRYCTRCGKAESDHVADPIGATVEELFDLLDRATQALRTLGRRDDAVLNAADKEKGRPSSLDHCLTCGREVPGETADARKGERLRSGYCPACYQAWRRWCKQRDDDGLDPSHVVFRWERRNERAAAELVDAG